jgi:hypothetical protein
MNLGLHSKCNRLESENDDTICDLPEATNSSGQEKNLLIFFNLYSTSLQFPIVLHAPHIAQRLGNVRKDCTLALSDSMHGYVAGIVVTFATIEKI